MKKSRSTAIAMIALLMAAARALADYAQTFQLDVSDWQDKPKSVCVAGSFNGWNKEANKLTQEGDTLWKVTLNLPEGVHTYKFVVDGERWLTDPKADASLEVDDTFGGKNSGVIVGPDARKFPQAQPNLINAEGLIHSTSSTADVNVVSATQLRLRLRVQAGDVEKVNVWLAGAEKSQPLSKLEPALGFDSYGGVIDVAQGPAKYVFELIDGTRTVYLGAGGVSNDRKEAEKKPFDVEMKTAFLTPDWAQNAVWYQIFPERFRNGDKSNDPGDKPGENLVAWNSRWFDAQSGEEEGRQGFFHGRKQNVWTRRYGGDVQGLKESLPYLRKLGVTALYLNPMFEAESMHKYDTSDFRHIDDNFGKRETFPIAGETDDPSTWQWSESDKVFLDFVAEAHRQGFKVVIDGVFNHVGRAHPFFQDVLKNGKNSRYADWFEITDWGDPAHWREMEDPYLVHGKPGGIQWKAWDQDSGHLPVFRKNGETGLAKGPYEHVMAITKRWLAPDGDPSRGVDGWRLDVANDIPHPFWREWRKVVKQAKPDAYIAGEIWSPAQPWLQGDQFDGVMNYQFAMAAQDFFVDVKTATTPSAFLRRLTDIVYMYPQQASLAQMNLFDSHDTDRVASMFVNPDRPYDGANRTQDNGPDYSARKPNDIEQARLKQAVACQMTFLGSPMIYYGTEAGMWSPDDPSNRQPMLWQDLLPYGDPEIAFDQKLFDAYRRMIAVRQTLPALRTGEFFPVTADDGQGIAVYGRRLKDQVVYVALNRSGEPRQASFKIPAEWTDKPVIDWLDSASIDLIDPADKPDARSTVAPKADARPLTPADGTLIINLPAYGSAVLAAR